MGGPHFLVKAYKKIEGNKQTRNWQGKLDTVVVVYHVTIVANGQWTMAWVVEEMLTNGKDKDKEL